MKTLIFALLVSVTTAALATPKPVLPAPANDDFKNARQTIAGVIDYSLREVRYSRPEDRKQFSQAVQDWFARPESANAPELFERALPQLLRQASHVGRASIYGGSGERIELLEILRKPFWRKVFEANGFREKLRYSFPNAGSLIPAATDTEVARWIFDEEDLTLSEEFASMAERIGELEKGEAWWRFYDQYRGKDSKLKTLKWSDMRPLYQEKLVAAMKAGLNGKDDRSLFEVGLHILPNEVLDDVIEASSRGDLIKAMSWSFGNLSEQDIARLISLRHGQMLINAMKLDRYYSQGMHLKLLKALLKSSNDIGFILATLPTVDVRYAMGSDYEDRSEADQAQAEYMKKYAALLPEVYAKIEKLGATFSQLRTVVGCMPDNFAAKKNFETDVFARAETAEQILSGLHLAETPAQMSEMWSKELPRLMQVLTGSRWQTIPGDYDRLPPGIVDRLYTEGLTHVKTGEDFLHITRALSEYPQSSVVAKAMRVWSNEVARFYPSKVSKEQLEKAIKVYIGSQPSRMQPLIDAAVKAHGHAMTCESLF